MRKKNGNLNKKIFGNFVRSFFKAEVFERQREEGCCLIFENVFLSVKSCLKKSDFVHVTTTFFLETSNDYF